MQTKEEKAANSTFDDFTEACGIEQDPREPEACGEKVEEIIGTINGIPVALNDENRELYHQIKKGSTEVTGAQMRAAFPEICISTLPEEKPAAAGEEEEPF